LDEQRDGTVYLPRGAVGLLREALAAAGEQVVFQDHRVLLPKVTFPTAPTLRDYQQTASAALKEKLQGYAVIPCGGGKTRLAVATIGALGQPALVLVHTHDLLDQWLEAIRTGLGLEAGTITEGVSRPDLVTVATVQTLVGMEPDELTRIGRQFGVVVVDEAHKTPSTTFRQVLSALPGRYRFGLTATPGRADGLTPLLELCIGPCLYRVTHEELVAAGHLVLPEIVAVPTNCAPDAEDHTHLVSWLVGDSARNKLITDLAAQDAREGHSVLVLSGRVEHCRRLANALVDMGVEALALTGSVPRNNRVEILDRFRAGAFRVLCATSLADEGLDVPGLSRLILATPARAEGRTIQRLGRLMRTCPGKPTPRLYDLVDDHSLAQSQYRARQRAYRKVLGVASTVPFKLSAKGSGCEI
jgi:superfamily II DNA or RNA helicase